MVLLPDRVHKPTALTDPLDPRSATYQLASGVAIYGGFAGTESEREQRDWVEHETVLSGDIGVVEDSSDNAYHVVTGSGTDETAVLDGFTITGGRAAGAGPLGRGGGLYTEAGSPVLSNITFSANWAEWAGSGMYNITGDPRLVNAVFDGNTGGVMSVGGGLSSVDGSPVLINVAFQNNYAYGSGGMQVVGGSATLIDVVFRENRAGFDGGGMTVQSSNSKLQSVIFQGNSSDLEAGGLFNRESNPSLTNVVFSGNWAPQGGAMSNMASNPSLSNVAFSGNGAGTGGGMYNRNGSTITLGNCILWGNSAYMTGNQIYNADTSTAIIGYSDIEGSGGSGSGWDGALGTDGGGNIDVDPLFVDASADDLHLQASSPAIDAGDNSAVPPEVTTDLDGNPRIVNGIVDMGAYEYQAASTIEASIDIKPPSPANRLNLESKGMVRVAILTTGDLDATEVDPETVLFADTPASKWEEKDVDSDGALDLLLSFPIQELNLDFTSEEATLEGFTYGGEAFSGTDLVSIVE